MKVGEEVIRLGLLALVTIAALISGFAACAAEPETDGGPLVITDRAGRDWDVTHAQEAYGMERAHFNYGLGLGAIPSVDDPTMLSEGDPGYPEPDSEADVFGVVRGDQARAYSVDSLTRHEVFNDHFAGEPNQYVAVAY